MYTKVFCNGSGNSFFLLHRNDFKKINGDDVNIKTLSNFNRTNQVDGVIIISQLTKDGYTIDYYNCDGTWETLCVNGSLCAAKYMFNHFITKNTILFHAGDGVHTATNDNSQIWISINQPKILSNDLLIANYKGSLIDSGSQHFCILVDICIEENVIIDGPKIRNHKIFLPKGTNVNFIEKHSSNKIKVFTYEKGVEKFMSSCGSGSAAAFFYVYGVLKHTLNPLSSPYTIETPGGNFKILCSHINNRLINWELGFSLSGPVEITYIDNFLSLNL